MPAWMKTANLNVIWLILKYVRRTGNFSEDGLSLLRRLDTASVWPVTISARSSWRPSREMAAFLFLKNCLMLKVGQARLRGIGPTVPTSAESRPGRPSRKESLTRLPPAMVNMAEASTWPWPLKSNKRKSKVIQIPGKNCNSSLSTLSRRRMPLGSL